VTFWNGALLLRQADGSGMHFELSTRVLSTFEAPSGTFDSLRQMRDVTDQRWAPMLACSGDRAVSVHQLDAVDLSWRSALLPEEEQPLLSGMLIWAWNRVVAWGGYQTHMIADTSCDNVSANTGCDPQGPTSQVVYDDGGTFAPDW